MRPVYHWLSMRVKAHVFLCMLAHYVEHHMRVALAPLRPREDLVTLGRRLLLGCTVTQQVAVITKVARSNVAAPPRS